MAGLISYVVMSVVMAVIWTIVITSNTTDIEDFNKYSKAAFISYFFVANLLAWPVYCIFMVCYIMYDYKG